MGDLLLTISRADRANQAIMDQQSALKDDLHALDRKFDERLDRIERLLSSQMQTVANEPNDVEPNVRSSQTFGSPVKRTATDATSTPMVPLQRSMSRDHRPVRASPSGSLITSATDSTITAPEISTAPEPTLTVEHTTGAHRLLGWPSIRALFAQSEFLRNIDDSYVMHLEEDMGVLRVYGRGQGRDTGDNLTGASPGSTSSLSMSRSEHESPVSSPESSLWGTELNAPLLSEGRPPSDIGGLKEDSTLKIDSKTCHHLMGVYLDNIHLLHPFLDKSWLSSVVDRFAKKYDPIGSSRASFVVPATNLPIETLRDPPSGYHRPSKRKHSDGHYYGAGADSAPTGTTMLFERSVTTAIVLLVMALGKICEWRDPLPGPAPDNIREKNPPLKAYPPKEIESPPPLSIRQSPPSSTPSSTSAPSPMSGVRVGNSSLALTEDAARSSASRNVEKIPGLAYFAKATDILGNIHGGNDIPHVQANLLAGLYVGQLARSFESWSFIFTACRACRYLVRE